MDCYMPTIRLNGHHTVQIYEENLTLDFNGHSQTLRFRAPAIQGKTPLVSSIAL